MAREVDSAFVHSPDSTANMMDAGGQLQLARCANSLGAKFPRTISRRIVVRRHGRHPILVLLVPDRNRINAVEPAAEVNIGAAPAAEWLVRLHGRFAAYRAQALLRQVLGDFGVFGH